jgi:3'-phosphoadenosine 5'-phosphosulfate sulfotransferase (PAPS reductase)/FAD synthetase
MLLDHKTLRERQDLPLHHKITMSLERIEEWYNHWHGEVYVSFSGGKDSTVLLHLVRRLYPWIPGVFVDTGLEYPEIRNFVKSSHDIIWLKPKFSFKKVIEKYGYPVVSKEVSQKLYEIRTTKSEKLKNKRLHGDIKGYGKLPKKWNYLIETDFGISHKCCDVLKKGPIKKYEKATKRAALVGTMASDSYQRASSYLQRGCNSFDSKRPMSTPLGFWTERDIWEYLKIYKISYSNIYKKGYERTGCMFCMFGVHLEKSPNRFQRMKETHPAQYNYCINKLGCGEVLDYIGIDY